MNKYKLSNWKAFNERRPQKYDKQLGVQFFTGNWDEIILHNFPKELGTAKILDVGCATGRLILSLLQAGAKTVAGVDLAPRMISVARQKLQQAGFISDLKACDVEQEIPWPSSYFDVVVMTGVLHHFTNPSHVVKEIYRVLGTNSYFCVIEPWLPFPIREAVNMGLKVVPREGDVFYYTPLLAQELFLRNGFNDTAYRRVSRLSFLLSGRKE